MKTVRKENRSPPPPTDFLSKEEEKKGIRDLPGCCPVMEGGKRKKGRRN